MPSAVSSVSRLRARQRLAAFNALDQSLESDADGKVLRIANRMFTDTAFTPSEDYRVALATYFGAGAEPAPLATNGEAAAKQINGWISEQDERAHQGPRHAGRVLDLTPG